MAKLDKGTLALTFKFDCDRFLRFRLASDAEKDTLGVSAETYKRPGIELIKAAGRRWEADKYQDLIDTSDDGKVVFLLEDKVDDLLGRKPFKKIQNLFDILRQQEPPQAIIEAEFTVPTNITPGLQKAYDDFGLDQVRVRPDILWIRPGGTGAPLIGNGTVPEYEIHIIDVKMAAEPSLRHFTEVTYYALALATAIQQEGLSGRYAVSAEGTIWPGSHDINAFRNLVQLYQAKGAADPVSEALSEPLIRVPYEVYEVHVKQFFEDRLLRVLQTDMDPPPFVDTVDRFQGQERDLILSSYVVADRDFVASEDAFILSPRRFNVTLTRARSKFVMLISDALLQYLPSDPDVARDAAHLQLFAEQYCSSVCDTIDLPFFERGALSTMRCKLRGRYENGCTL